LLMDAVISSGRKRYNLLGHILMRTTLPALVIRKLSYFTSMSLLTKMKGSLTRGRFTAAEQHKQVETDKEEFLNMGIEDKRKMYKCKTNFVELSSIPCWPEYFKDNIKDDPVSKSWWKNTGSKHKVEGIESSDRMNSKISIFTGDITSLEIDAIANAANESLLGGGGVDGAIHAAAGPKLRSECELLNGCDTGDAKCTGGYKLPAKYVLHTVGPRGEKPEALQSCYQKCMDLLKENNLRSVAFPCISTGIFGYPNENAAKVALRTVRNWLETEEYSKHVDRVIFCLFLAKDVKIYGEQMQLYFPLDRTTAAASLANAEEVFDAAQNLEKTDISRQTVEEDATETSQNETEEEKNSSTETKKEVDTKDSFITKVNANTENDSNEHKEEAKTSDQSQS